VTSDTNMSDAKITHRATRGTLWLRWNRLPPVCSPTPRR